MRMDLYRLIHKAQRFHLFLLANRMGRSDFQDSDEATSIGAELRTLIEHLRDHARNEEIYIHPLFDGIDRMAESLEMEHQALEADLGELAAIVAEQRWSELYPAYNRFIATYLEHLDNEEHAQSEILWPNYQDDELLAVFNRFKAERTPQAARADLELMLPALSVLELSQMFRGIKASAPPAAFQGICELAALRLGDSTWQQVASHIS